MSYFNYMNFFDAWDDWADKVYATAEKNGFHAGRDDNTPLGFAASIALQHEELSDALKAMREETDDGPVMDRHLTNRTRIEVKLADVIVRIMDTGKTRGYDLGRVIQEKIEYNDTRPYLHGKKI